MICQYFGYKFIISILLYSVYNMRRKLFLLKQMALIISPRKLRFFDLKKLLPTIDIFSPLNLKGWIILTKIIFDYG